MDGLRQSWRNGDTAEEWSISTTQISPAGQVDLSMELLDIVQPFSSSHVSPRALSYLQRSLSSTATLDPNIFLPIFIRRAPSLSLDSVNEISRVLLGLPSSASNARSNLALDERQDVTILMLFIQHIFLRQSQSQTVSKYGIHAALSLATQLLSTAHSKIMSNMFSDDSTIEGLLEEATKSLDALIKHIAQLWILQPLQSTLSANAVVGVAMADAESTTLKSLLEEIIGVCEARKRMKELNNGVGRDEAGCGKGDVRYAVEELISECQISDYAPKFEKIWKRRRRLMNLEENTENCDTELEEFFVTLLECGMFEGVAWSTFISMKLPTLLLSLDLPNIKEPLRRACSRIAAFLSSSTPKKDLTSIMALPGADMKLKREIYRTCFSDMNIEEAISPSSEEMEDSVMDVDSLSSFQTAEDLAAFFGNLRGVPAQKQACRMVQNAMNECHDSHESQTFANLCQALTDSRDMFNLVVAFMTPQKIAEKVLQMMDAFDVSAFPGDDLPLQWFGQITLFLEVLIHQYGRRKCLEHLDIPRDSPSLIWLKSRGAIYPLSQLDKESVQLIDNWILGLFGPGLSDELTGQTNPRMLLKLAPTLYMQCFTAWSQAILELEQLKDALSYFSNSILNFTLPSIIHAVLSHLHITIDTGDMFNSAKVIIEVLQLTLADSALPPIILELIADELWNSLKDSRLGRDDTALILRTKVETYVTEDIDKSLIQSWPEAAKTILESGSQQYTFIQRIVRALGVEQTTKILLSTFLSMLERPSPPSMVSSTPRQLQTFGRLSIYLVAIEIFSHPRFHQPLEDEVERIIASLAGSDVRPSALLVEQVFFLARLVTEVLGQRNWLKPVEGGFVVDVFWQALKWRT